MTRRSVRPKFKIPLLSFFTGGGFLDMGFEMAGFNVTWTNENNSAFAELYKQGFSSWRSSTRASSAEITETRSIEDLTEAEILSKAFGTKRPALFGVIGGPPCQDFSSAGKHLGAEGPRGRLTRMFVSLICKLLPDFFVLENVAGLLKYTRHRTLLLELEDILKKAGYLIDREILNALDFGVPQNRERVFLVGISSKIIGNIQPAVDWFPWREDNGSVSTLTKFKWPKTNKFGQRPRKPRGLPEELCVGNYLVSRRQRIKVPNANNLFIAHSPRFSRIAEGDTSGKSFKRLHRYRYSPTACYGNNEVHLHPWEPRRLSLREVMRIQRIPDSYILPENSSLSTKFRLVGNGVPVPLALHVASALRKLLESFVS
jgi:DNA (cytosine-5)-methyltransferase 1